MAVNIRKERGSHLSRSTREAFLGYTLVAPTLLLIIIVALFPVLRTFWLSTFDLRLNNMALSKTYLNYQLDIEHYADTYYRFNNIIKKLVKSEDPVIASTAAEIQKEYGAVHAILIADENIKGKFTAVYDMVVDMKPVSDEKLRYIQISDQLHDQLTESFAVVKDRFQKLYDGTKERNVKMALQIVDDMFSAFRAPNFIGLRNYADLFSDSRLALSILNTFNFVIFTVFFELVLGIIFALVMNKNFRGRGIVRASVLIPWSIPAAVSALMWRFMYDGQYGIMAKVFAAVGIVGDPGHILTTRGGAMFGLIFADVWKTTPFMALLLLAGLQTIDDNLYEASLIDGATKIQQFLRITLPLLKPSIMVALLFRTLDTVKVFDLVSVMTNGGPANSTETISVFSYRVMFENMNFGMGSAIAVVLFVIVALVSLLYVKVLGAELIKAE